MRKLSLILLSILLCVSSCAACAEDAAYIPPAEITINGELIALPITVSDIIANGWEPSFDEEQINVAKGLTHGGELIKDGVKISPSVRNYSINSAPAADCHVTSIYVNLEYASEQMLAAEILLPGGLALGKSTAIDMINAYGEPTKTSESGNYIEYMYGSYSTDSYMIVKAAIGTRIIYNVTIADNSMPEGFYEGDISSEIPEYVANYAAPAAVSDALFDKSVAIDSVLYNMPFPVQALLDDGWTLSDSENTAFIVGNEHKMLLFKKEGNLFQATVENYSPQAMPIGNCMVSSVTIQDMPFEIAGHIAIGETNESELLSIIDGYEYEKKASGKNDMYAVLDPVAFSKSSSYYFRYTLQVYVNPALDTVVAILYSATLD